MRPYLVVLGVSQGAMEALRSLLNKLPPGFPAALAMVVHREKEELADLVPLLQKHCTLPLGSPLDKEIILPGHVYLAPPNYHLLVDEDHFAFSLDAPENFARPSIDVLFESAALACGAALTGIVLTGTGCDGARGLAAIRRRGGLALVQSPDEAAAREMPLAALAAVPDARILTLVGIGERLAEVARPEAGTPAEKDGRP